MKAKKTPRLQSYSNERFDLVTALALQLAADARANGRPEPAYGYSAADWRAAEEKFDRNRA